MQGTHGGSFGMHWRDCLGCFPSRAEPVVTIYKPLAVTHEQTMDPASWQEGFAPQPPSLTGVTFTNRLNGDAFLTDAVAHNGSGVAIGDVNGDGLEDLFSVVYSANQLYLQPGPAGF